MNNLNLLNGINKFILSAKENNDPAVLFGDGIRRKLSQGSRKEGSLFSKSGGFECSDSMISFLRENVDEILFFVMTDKKNDKSGRVTDLYL